MTNINIPEIIKHIEDGTATRNEIFTATSYMMDNRMSIPPALELKSLEYLIADYPNNVQFKRRMVSVYNLLKKTPPEALAIELTPEYIQEEYNTNFQESMQEYSDKVGYKDFDADFFPLLEYVRNYTMTSVERLYALWNCIGYLCGRQREGDFMEVGVWRGGSMMLAAFELLRRKEREMRHIWLYDTFTGLPRPNETLDTDILGNRAIDGWLPRNFADDTSVWAYASEEEVRSNMDKTGYPSSFLHFIAGKVEKTIPDVIPEKIALLRVDTDFYSSYKHTLEYVYDHVVEGGIVILDDYGHFCGARKAVDEFLKKRKICALMHRPDYSCRIFVKES